MLQQRQQQHKQGYLQQGPWRCWSIIVEHRMQACGCFARDVKCVETRLCPEFALLLWAGDHGNVYASRGAGDAVVVCGLWCCR
jgi:hypothetical protein